MAIVLIELRRGAAAPDDTKYVLRAETLQHQIARQPTVITIPGAPDTGEPNILGYDLGIAQETITVSGLVAMADEDVGVDDPAYEAGVAKVYPGKLSLRTAALYWWADADWAAKTGYTKLLTPLGEEYEGVLQQCQFTLEPAKEVYGFSLVFRVLKF